MLSFDHPVAGAAMLLLVPYLLWLRQPRPRTFVVGGFEPFLRNLAHGPGKRKFPPRSFWWFFAAYLLASFALSMPRLRVWPSLLLVDGSFSVVRAGLSPPAGFDEVRVLGDPEHGIAQREILETMAGIEPGRPFTVWTDQPAPAGLPRWVDWQNQGFLEMEKSLGAILQVLPIDAHHWRVHWALSAGESARWVLAGWRSDPFSGSIGTDILSVANYPAVINLERARSPQEGVQILDSRTLPIVRFFLSSSVHKDWLAAFYAVWPPALISRMGEGNSKQQSADSFVSIQIGTEDVLRPAVWLDLPWTQSPAAKDVAKLATGWRSLISQIFPASDPGEMLTSTLLLKGEIYTPAKAGSGNGSLPRWIPWLLLVGLLCAGIGWWKLPPAVSTFVDEY